MLKKNTLTIVLSLMLNLVFAQTGSFGKVKLTLKDITPRFVAFYDSAIKVNATESERWVLWKKMYDFAATPPTPAGDSIARRLLDSAWSRYISIVPLIKNRISQQILSEAEQTAGEIARLLQPDSSFEIRLRTYVGGFEVNAFTTAYNKQITTALPIEIPEETRRSIMVHELVHAVHIGMGSFSGGWQRTIGATVVTEGLAMRATQHIQPGKPDADYTEYTKGWLRKAAEKNYEILRDVRSVLYSDSIPDIMRFTMGEGPAGLEREAYYAGWVVVGYWIAHGKPFSGIARIPEKEMPKEVASTIDLLLNSKQ